MNQDAKFQGMLLEIARPVALLLCILSLFAVFHAAFLNPAAGVEQRMWDALQLLVVATGISLISGELFLDPPAGKLLASAPESPAARLISTLPMQVYWWTVGAMSLLFVTAWYLESQCPIDCRDHFLCQ